MLYESKFSFNTSNINIYKLRRTQIQDLIRTQGPFVRWCLHSELELLKFLHSVYQVEPMQVLYVKLILLMICRIKNQSLQNKSVYFDKGPKYKYSYQDLTFFSFHSHYS